jgi:hypothetical protein
MRKLCHTTTARLSGYGRMQKRSSTIEHCLAITIPIRSALAPVVCASMLFGTPVSLSTPLIAADTPKSASLNVEQEDQFNRDLTSYLSETRGQDDRRFHAPDRSLSISAAYGDLVKPERSSGIELIINTGKFIGFAEKAMNASVPDWWTESLAAGRNQMTSFAPRSHVRFRPITPQLSVLDSRGYRVADGKVMIEGHGLIQIRDIEALLTAQNDKSLSYVSVAHDQSHVFVAFYNDFGVPYLLHAIDKTTKRESWSANIWSGGQRVTVGRSSHVVELKVVNAEVVVFGCESSCLYMEAFGVNDGRPSVRFRTNAGDGASK